MNQKFKEATKGLYPSGYNDKVRARLQNRYGEAEAETVWTKLEENFLRYLKDMPELGGKKNGHASAIYGGLLIFSLYPALPDQPPISELQDFVQKMFLEPFTKIGKIVDLNSKAGMWLIDKVFQYAGKRDRRDILKYPDGFVNISDPYDKAHCASRYRFTQCPNAEFAKKHDLMHVLPLLCNSDFFGISEIHGTLIRCGTCGNSSQCDYLVVGSENPIAKEYETLTDEGGFLVSKRKSKNPSGEGKKETH